MCSIILNDILFTAWADCAAENAGDFSAGQKLLVKYSYTANPNSPLGEGELTVRQKEEVTFMLYNADNPLWCKVSLNGAEGYVPSNYLIVSVINQKGNIRKNACVTSET